jgi:tetratricopeptide (TPR) repeat protein
MEGAAPPGFLDVDRLLDSSEPQPRLNLVWWIGGMLVVVMLGTGLMAGQSAESRHLVSLLSAFAMVIMVGGISVMSVYTIGNLRREQQQVEQIGELVQLGRWSEAGMALERYLSKPARTPQFRAQSLVFLASVLARLQRYGDAIAVQNYLIEESLVDAGGAAALKIGRVMAMLHEDHLFDADRAISELRRGPAAGSAALALVEICRDVKTGHPTEAIELFEKKLPTLRDELGHRVADAYVLAARAYDLLGREADAALAFQRATLLAPTKELFRRYPEAQKLADRYHPAVAPPEAA